jgi:hypothetical protein
MKNLTRGSKNSRGDPGYDITRRSVLLGKILNFFVNDSMMVPVSSIITDIAFVLTFKIRCMYIALLLCFKIFLFPCLVTFIFPEIIMLVKRFIFLPGIKQIKNCFHALKENVQHQRNSVLSNTFVVLRNSQFYQLDE